MSEIVKNLIKSYYKSADVLYKTDREAFAAPVFVLKTFAAELSLKWLLKLENRDVPKIHYFDKLFN